MALKAIPKQHKLAHGTRRLRRGFIPLLAVGAVLSACSSNPANSSSSAAANGAAETSGKTHPESGLALTNLQVKSANAVHNFTVEIAATRDEQTQGLMFRKALGPDEGMIFPYVPTRPASFWMKNTPLPLDIIFVGPDGRIINIGANAVPYSLDPVSSDGPTSLILEIPGGRAAELGIKPGDMVVYAQAESGGE